MTLKSTSLIVHVSIVFVYALRHRDETRNEPYFALRANVRYYSTRQYSSRPPRSPIAGENVTLESVGERGGRYTQGWVVACRAESAGGKEKRGG